MGTTAKTPSEIRKGSNRLYKLTELANELGVHENSIRAWLDKGLITARQTPGGTLVWTGQDILDLLDQMKANGQGANDAKS